MATVRELLATGSKRLSEYPTARLDAEILLAQAAGFSRSFIYAHPKQNVARDSAESFSALVERRAAGEPVAYIMGERDFWSLALKVTPAVLIPRPETETLVEAALARIPPEGSFRVADLGTGSGAIALAVALERPACEVHATEYSPEALALAAENAARLNVENISFHAGSWCDPLSGKFRLIASNPPYIAQGDAHLEQGDLRFEPHSALVSGHDGLEDIRAIIGQSGGLLEPGGWLVLEHGHEQAEPCRDLLKAGGFQSVETLRDLGGTERVTLGART